MDSVPLACFQSVQVSPLPRAPPGGMCAPQQPGPSAQEGQASGRDSSRTCRWSPAWPPAFAADSARRVTSASWRPAPAGCCFPQPALCPLRRSRAPEETQGARPSLLDLPLGPFCSSAGVGATSLRTLPPTQDLPGSRNQSPLPSHAPNRLRRKGLTRPL